MDKIEFFPSKYNLPDLCHLSVGSFSSNSDLEMLLPDYVCVNKRANAVLLIKGPEDCVSKGGKQVSVQLETSTGEVTAAQIKYNNDGSYTASFIAKQVGKAKLFVSVDGKFITGSPYSIEICRDYEALNEPDQFLEESSFCMGQHKKIAFSLCGLWAVLINDQVCIFDGQRQLVRKIRKHPSNLIKCQGIAFGVDNDLYVTDRCCVKKFDVHGNYLLQFGGSSSSGDHLNSTQGITIHNGRVYVADCVIAQRKGRVLVFLCDGQFCTSISADELYSAYVVDHNGHKVCIFTLDGQYVGCFASNGLEHPNSLATDKNGFIFVTDSYYRVMVFDQHGNFIHSFTGSYNHTLKYDSFYSIAVNPDGTIYVSGYNTKAIEIFTVY